MWRDRSAAIAIPKCNFMNAIRVDDDHGSVAWDRILAESSVVELDYQAQRLQRHLFE